jgi:hypothetical protein
MAKVIAIVGETGTGKSTSIKFLNPADTYIINTAKKELPFRGSSGLYNEAKKNYAELDEAKEILEKLQKISKNAPHIKNVVIEDSNYIMGFTMIRKALETGYTKFSVMAKDMTDLILGAKELRKDLHIFYFTHPEEVKDGEEIISYKIKTAGKLLDSQIKLEGLFTVVLYTYVEQDRKGDVSYQFLTNRHGKYPAKSPEGMFEELKIPNNLQIVTEAIDAYYKAPTEEKVA